MDNNTNTVFRDVSYTLARGETNLTLTGTGNIYGSGNNADNILTGNDGINRLNSGRGNDTVYGNGGNDVINGGDGQDTLYGGTGNDMVNGDNGDDVLYGDEGNDTLNGGTGNDILKGGAGEDVYVMNADSGNDTLSDNEGSNTVRFGPGININQLTVISVASETGTDWVIEIDSTSSLTIKQQYTAGNTQDAAVSTFVFDDNVSYTASEFAQLKHVTLPRRATQAVAGRIEGTDNDDVLNGTEGNDRISGYRGNDVLYGSDGNDTLSGGIGDDILYGGNGNDKLEGGDGKDTLIGGKGNDSYTLNDADDIIIEQDGEGIDSVTSAFSYTLTSNVENLTLSGSANIYGAGNNSDNILTGNDGNNRLNSGRGNDTVYGGGGNDTINGGDGNDKLYGQLGNDTINGDAGNDELSGGSGLNYLNGGAGNDTYLVGAGGHDIIRDTQGSNIIQYHADSIREVSVFTSQNSDGSTDWILFSQHGVATLKNQFTGGSDTPAFDIFEIAGTRYSAQELMDAAGSDGKFGAFVINTQFNTAATLQGTAGNDYIKGGQNDATPYNAMRIGSSPNEKDTLYGYDGDDILIDRSNTYYGRDYASDDKFYGGAGNDRIYASIGSDYLDGGSGNDYMEGGDHRDTYAFGRGSGQDTVFDYNFVPDYEFQLHVSNANKVLFGEGISIEDLTLSSSTGYDRSNISFYPEGYSYMEAPIVNGDTWVISIKDSEDTLTILNQKATGGAISVFEFANGTSYTAADFANKLSEQAAAANII